jgi:hypothetical protein
MHAAAAVGAGPGLHRGKRRDDVETAGDRKSGEINRHADALRRGEHRADAHLLEPERQAPGRPAEIEREQGEAHGANERRQDDDAAGGKPGGQARADRDGH